MNYKVVVASGIIAAAIGALFGWAVSYIGQPDLDRQQYESRFYRTLYRRYPLVGAGLGFAAGAGFAIIQQAKHDRDRNNSNF